MPKIQTKPVEDDMKKQLLKDIEAMRINHTERVKAIRVISVYYTWHLQPDCDIIYITIMFHAIYMYIYVYIMIIIITIIIMMIFISYYCKPCNVV